MTTIPTLALSVRQPWAWAILHARKDRENRSAASIRLGDMRRQIGRRIAIHAGKGLTRDEYDDAADFIRQLAGDCPPAADLMRGGIIGSVLVAGIITNRAEAEAMPSPWFFGPCALILADREPCDFIGAGGQLGMFAWTPNGQAPEPPARWMLPKVAATVTAKQGALL